MIGRDSIHIEAQILAYAVCGACARQALTTQEVAS